MKTDYTIKKNRIAAIDKIDNDCIAELRIAGIELCKKAACCVSDNYVEIGLKKRDTRYISMLSTISFYPKQKSFGRIKEAGINFGSSGSFTPKETAAYWRTITAASLLKNWKVSCQIITKYCKQYAKLADEIMKRTNPDQ